MMQALDTPIGFIVGDSLGKLLKWLRILGFNAVPARDLRRGRATIDPKVYDIVELTRSRSISAEEGKPLVRINTDHVFEQLAEVFSARRITREHLQPFSRCTRCNTPIEIIDKVDVRGRVPDYVWEMHDGFSRCPCCQRIFWRGTHAENVIRIIERIFQGER